MPNDVCEKACSLLNVKCIEDLSCLEDRDIDKLELQVVDWRKFEKLVRQVRSQSVKKPAKEVRWHVQIPGNVDAEIARFTLTVGINHQTHVGTLPHCREDAMAIPKELEKHNFRVHTVVDWCDHRCQLCDSGWRPKKMHLSPENVVKYWQKVRRIYFGHLIDRLLCVGMKSPNFKDSLSKLEVTS